MSVQSSSKVAELLIEIFSEEIPARMQLKACDELKIRLNDYFMGKGLVVQSIETYVTPRRLAVCAMLPTQTQERMEERRGPRLNAPEKALEGFLNSCGISKDKLIEKDGYFYASIHHAPQDTLSMLSAAIEEILKNMPWEKSMRWPQYPQTWVRPIRGLVCIFDGTVLKANINGLIPSNEIRGHRFLSGHAKNIANFSDYKETLLENFVVLDHGERQQIIKKQLQELSQEKNLILNEDDALLKEVAGLVEWPCSGLGSIKEEFMQLPEAVLITSMRVHQKYFTFKTQDGKIAPYFAFIANRPITEIMRQGYERVLKARLNDAMFFYQTDLQQPLETHLPKLDQIVFHAKLGSLGQKVKRLVGLMDGEQGKRAAQLCKADLMTKMVYEFPELQGIMGQVYATHHKEPVEVAQAIREHYQPQGPNDNCPTAPLSRDLALAEKIDSLVGFFAVNEQPTGSKDPYALRRNALGIIRLIRHNNMQDLNLKSLILRALNQYKAQGINISSIEDKANEIFDFIIERLKIQLQNEGIRHDYVTAVLGNTHQLNRYNVWSLQARTQALNTYFNKPEGLQFLDAYRRAYGILEQANIKHFDKVELSNLNEPQEKDLFTALEKVKPQSEAALSNQDYDKLMTVLAPLHSPIQSFFDLTINHEDEAIRKKRLGLLNYFIEQLSPIADLSKVEK